MCRNDVPIDSLTVPSRDTSTRGFLSKFPIVGIFDGENYLFSLFSSDEGRGDYSLFRMELYRMEVRSFPFEKGKET